MPIHSESMPLEDLRCPVCLARIEDDEGTIRCTGCGQQLRHENGIPDLRLSRFDYYFNPIPKDRMRSLSSKLDADNWARSVREFIRLSPTPSWVDNVAVQGRYAWKVLMHLPADGRVLDIGCGLGALISSIAPHVKTAYATDLTMERLIFSKGRFRIFNTDDEVRTVASGDGPHLPFPDASFDAVFISGVLEWIGEGDTSGFHEGSKWRRLVRMLGAHFGDTNPQRLQLRFLREVRRILKPEGELYVGIENRLSHTYFGRRRDHHSGLWFGSLMPRFMATLYSIAVTRRPYRTYTHSLRGYQRLFSKAGFDAIELFGFNDGYTNLKSITPAAAEVDRWTPAAPQDWQDRISRHPYLVPAFGIMATPRSERLPRMLDRLLAEVENRLGDKLVFFSLDVSQNDKALLRGKLGDTPILVKLSMSATSEDCERLGAETLRVVRAATPELQPRLPEPLISGRYQQQAYFVETRLPGMPLSPDRPESELRTAVQTIRNFLDTGLGEGDPTRFDSILYERHVTPRLAVLEEALEDRAAADLIADFFHETLEGLPVRSGLMHGDPGFEHALFQDGRLTGLVDWHTGSVDGLPVIDAVSLAVHALSRETPDRTLPEVLERLAGGNWRGSVAETALTGHLDEAAISPRHRYGVVYLYWLFHLSDRLPFRLQYEPARISALVTPVLDFMRVYRRRAA